VAKPKLRERTVQFYEVVVEKGGELLRVGQFPFVGALAAIAPVPVAARRWEGLEQDLIGTVHTVEDEDHLLLHRVKDGGEWLAVMNLETGDWHELESKAKEGYLDTSAIVFLPYGNVVGMMQGATSAPSHKSLEGWLRGLKVFGDTPLVVRPLVSQAEVERLKGADGASRVEIRIGAHQTEALSKRQGRLAQFLQRATADYGDLRVTVTISVPPGGARAEDRRRLLNDLRDLEDVMPGAADVAKARLVYSDAGGEEYGRLAEFVEHHITAKRRVSAVDDEGNSIRLSEALRVITDAAVEHEDELRRAADVGPR
jgi:hypothetical protein